MRFTILTFQLLFFSHLHSQSFSEVAEKTGINTIPPGNIGIYETNNPTIQIWDVGLKGLGPPTLVYEVDLLKAQLTVITDEFAEPFKYPYLEGYGKSFDFNNDGFMDLIGYSDRKSGQALIFPGTAGSRFNLQDTLAVPHSWWRKSGLPYIVSQVEDINFDGSLDLILSDVVNQEPNLLYLNHLSYFDSLSLYKYFTSYVREEFWRLFSAIPTHDLNIDGKRDWFVTWQLRSDPTIFESDYYITDQKKKKYNLVGPDIFKLLPQTSPNDYFDFDSDGMIDRIRFP